MKDISNKIDSYSLNGCKELALNGIQGFTVRVYK